MQCPFDVAYQDDCQLTSSHLPDNFNAKEENSYFSTHMLKPKSKNI